MMKFKRLAGSSLIEVMLAVAVVSIAVIGGVSYRYYSSSLDGRRANIHTTTAGVALMLCES
jgi:Tfp pilus assembly protein PilV